MIQTILDNWQAIAAAIAAVAGVVVIFFPKLKPYLQWLPLVGKSAPAFVPRRALDGFDVLMDELTKGGLPAEELAKWRQDLFADLLKLSQVPQ